MKALPFGTVSALAALLTSALMAPAAVPDDKHWDNQFGPPGVGVQAYGIAAIGNKIYAVGTFSAAGNTKALGVAGFDGTNWFPLNGGLPGGGVNPVVISAAADNNYLYVGGIFTNADDPAANDSARWDGTSWAGIGIQGVIETARRNGGTLYFGGAFSGSTNLTSTNIIGWDGTNWIALGPGLGGNGFNLIGSVNCIAFQGNNIYAGGNFSYAGTSSMTNIAYWDGSAWHAMGNPFNGTVDALQFYNGYLYAGGSFTNSSLHCTNIARWDGSVWSAVPGGGADRIVSDFAIGGTNLFVCGSFTQIGGIAATNIVSFDGTTWNALGTGLHFFQNGLPQANKLCWSSNQLYVAGGFDRAGNRGAANVARWDGTNWWSLGGDTSKGMSPSLDFVQSLCNVPASGSIPGGLYAGGLFSTAGKTNANSIAYFDGTQWNAMGSGVSGWFSGAARVYAIATDGTYVYAGGNFTNAGAYTSVGGLAEWDGNNWYPLYYGVDYNVYALAADAFGSLWVGGAFTNINNAGNTKGLAIWNAGNWYSIGSVAGTNAIINALVYDGGTRIYMGGQFYSVAGVAATNIAYYDYTDGFVHPLGAGLNNTVNALASGNGMIYAGGTFTQSGATTLNHVAQWDGSSWSALANGLTGSSSANVLAIAVAGANVYVGGQNFTNASGVIVSNIAVWNGSTWASLGSGTEYGRNCSALAASGNDVYAGGNFNWAGDKPAQFIAHWNSQSNYYPAANILLTRTAWQTNQQFRFRVTGTSGQSYIIQATSDFMSWTPLQTNSTMFYDFSDVNSAGYPARFYRAILQP
jgi:trimeric autotransporter adhesin